MSKQHTNTIPPTVWQFLWQVIKPYRWWYLLMLQAPVLTAFYIFANNYSFKLLVDAFSINAPIQYSQLIFPITVFITAQIALDPTFRSKIRNKIPNIIYQSSQVMFSAYPSY